MSVKTSQPNANKPVSKIFGFTADLSNLAKTALTLVSLMNAGAPALPNGGNTSLNIKAPDQGIAMQMPIPAVLYCPYAPI